MRSNLCFRVPRITSAQRVVFTAESQQERLIGWIGAVETFTIAHCFLSRFVARGYCHFDDGDGDDDSQYAPYANT